MNFDKTIIKDENQSSSKTETEIQPGDGDDIQAQMESQQQYQSREASDKDNQVRIYINYYYKCLKGVKSVLSYAWRHRSIRDLYKNLSSLFINEHEY